MLTLMEHEKSNCRTDEHAPHLKLFYSVQAMPTSKVFYLLTLDAPNQNNVQSPVLPFVGTADESEGRLEKVIMASAVKKPVITIPKKLRSTEADHSRLLQSLFIISMPAMHFRQPELLLVVPNARHYATTFRDCSLA